VADPDPIPAPPDVALRDVTQADLSVFFEHQRDPDANHMAAVAARGRDAFLSHWATILADPSVKTQTVLLAGVVAGNVVSWDGDGERLAGYWIGREHWGRGVATRALAAFLSYDTARPLHARVAKHNLGSRRVLEKCGFTIIGEGVVPPDTTGGEAIEEYLFSLEV
jgi:RimJ/RimL family protein N-acetyltransferase